MTTFVDLANAGGGTQAGWIPYALPYAELLSSGTALPVDLILAQWVIEGTYSATSSGALCNDPGNAGYGAYCSTGLKTMYGSCSSFSANYDAPDATTGTRQTGDIFNNAYPQVAAAFAQSTLTTGGSSLRTWAVANSYGGLSNGTYNAAYQLGVGGTCGVWAGTHYVIGAGPYGSFLIDRIYNLGLTGYDSIFYACS